MTYRTLVVLLWLSILPALVLGCNSAPGMREVSPNVTVLEKVETLNEGQPPDWVFTPGKYEHASPDTEYFVGIGFPRQTFVFAMHSADEDAFANIAKYIGQAVAVKWQSAGEAKNLHGQQSIETVVEEFVKKTVSVARVKHARPVETYRERVSAHYHGTQVVMYRIYRLYAVPPEALAGVGRDSAASVAEEIQRERDEVRKEQLKKLEEMLQDLSVDDFKI